MAAGKKTGGRVKGVPNKTTALAKEAIEAAFEHLQGVKGKDLKSWAAMNTDDFYKLLFPKLLPVQMQHSGENGGPVKTVQEILLRGVRSDPHD